MGSFSVEDFAFVLGLKDRVITDADIDDIYMKGWKLFDLLEPISESVAVRIVRRCPPCLYSLRNFPVTPLTFSSALVCAWKLSVTGGPPMVLFRKHMSDIDRFFRDPRFQEELLRRGAFELLRDELGIAEFNLNIAANRDLLLVSLPSRQFEARAREDGMLIGDPVRDMLDSVVSRALLKEKYFLADIVKKNSSAYEYLDHDRRCVIGNLVAAIESSHSTVEAEVCLDLVSDRMRELGLHKILRIAYFAEAFNSQLANWFAVDEFLREFKKIQAGIENIQRLLMVTWSCPPALFRAWIKIARELLPAFLGCASFKIPLKVLFRAYANGRLMAMTSTSPLLLKEEVLYLETRRQDVVQVEIDESNDTWVNRVVDCNYLDDWELCWGVNDVDQSEWQKNCGWNIRKAPGDPLFGPRLGRVYCADGGAGENSAPPLACRDGVLRIEDVLGMFPSYQDPSSIHQLRGSL